MNNRRIDFGEYVVVINYNEEDSSITIDVLDEVGEIIESIEILNDSDDNDDNNDNNLNINLN